MKDNKTISYTVQKMTVEDAKKIGKWKYDPPYSMYSMTDNLEGIQELTDGTYYSVYNNDNLIGYFCYGKNAQVPGGIKEGLYKDENLLDIGLGLRPDLTGKGHGLCFFTTGLDFGKHKYGRNSFRLTVATFNQRAIKLYEKAGFQIVAQFIHKNGEKEVEFFVMEKF